nr:hypothetical protein [Halomicroarcula limicola]
MLTLGIVSLYITLLTTTLYGGAVPAYQEAVGAELAERTLAEATARVEQAVPPAGRDATATVRVDLPATIDGSGYEIRVDGDALVLAHPDPGVSARSRPVLPSRVATLSGEWQSGGGTVVTVTGDGENVTVRLEDGR